MILYPFQALAGSFHLGKIDELAFLRANYGSDHGGSVYHRFIYNGAYPSGSTGIYMCVAQAGSARAYSDQAGVAAAAENLYPLDQAQFRGSLLRDTAHAIGGSDDFR